MAKKKHHTYCFRRTERIEQGRQLKFVEVTKFEELEDVPSNTYKVQELQGGRLKCDCPVMWSGGSNERRPGQDEKGECKHCKMVRDWYKVESMSQLGFYYDTATEEFHELAF